MTSWKVEICLEKKKPPRAQIFRYFLIESRNKNVQAIKAFKWKKKNLYKVRVSEFTKCKKESAKIIYFGNFLQQNKSVTIQKNGQNISRQTIGR